MDFFRDGEVTSQKELSSYFEELFSSKAPRLKELSSSNEELFPNPVDLPVLLPLPLPSHSGHESKWRGQARCARGLNRLWTRVIQRVKLQAKDDLPSRVAGDHGASVLSRKMALLVEALNILLSGIWSF